MSEQNTTKFKLQNEFATVHVFIENSANGPRLGIQDVLRERTVYLDPLQVECLTRLDLNFLEKYLPY